MWLITDTNHVVQDKSSSHLNLSRGYIEAGVHWGNDVALLAAGWHKYEITELPMDVKVFDTYDGIKVTKNLKVRAQRELDGVIPTMVQTALVRDKANDLGFTDFKDQKTAEYNSLNTRKGELETIIAS